MMPDFFRYDDYVEMSENEFDAISTYIPEEVCHYTKMTTALKKILYNGTIRLSNLNRTNDPLESKLRLFQTVREFHSRFEPVGNVIAPGYLSNSFKVFCVSCHNK